MIGMTLLEIPVASHFLEQQTNGYTMLSQEFRVVDARGSAGGCCFLR